MKTAEQYWNWLQRKFPSGLFDWHECPRKRQDGFTQLVAAIRADALAEKPAAPDADEERAKRELARLDEFCRKHGMSSAPWGEQFRRGFADYIKTCPPRPMRSPGQVLNDGVRDALKAAGYESSYFRSNFHTELPEWKAGMEAAATALGIQPQE